MTTNNLDAVRVSAELIEEAEDYAMQSYDSHQEQFAFVDGVKYAHCAPDTRIQQLEGLVRELVAELMAIEIETDTSLTGGNRCSDDTLHRWATKALSAAASMGFGHE